MRDANEIPPNRRAPDGHVWQCMACGKVAEDKYGLIGRHSGGWDESCMLNCAPVKAYAALLPEE